MLALALGSVGAPAQDLQGKVEGKRAELGQAKDRRGVLTTRISAYSSRIDRLTGKVAALRNREARVQAELEEAREQLRIEKRNLRILRERLTRSLRILRTRLVAIYKNEAPDALTVVLESDGFDEVLEQYEYLDRIESQDSNIVARVRDLRNDQRATVARITEVRDAIAAKRDELRRTRVALESRSAGQVGLGVVRPRRQALDGVTVRELVGVAVGDLGGAERAGLELVPGAHEVILSRGSGRGLTRSSPRAGL